MSSEQPKKKLTEGRRSSLKTYDNNAQNLLKIKDKRHSVSWGKSDTFQFKQMKATFQETKDVEIPDKEKEVKHKELQTQEENNKKEIPDKILNKSPQKNQENYDDICNIRYLDEELNTNKKKENENDNNISKNKESEKLSQSEINRRLNFFDESATLPRKEKKGNINKEDEDDLVQEKPDDYSNDDNINIKDESDIKENINNEEEQKGMNNNIEKELQQNMKESETLKDSYCDKLLKNMDEYRKMVNSNES